MCLVNMANIRDVARKSNCSIATVSRVLSQDESFVVSESKKQQIFDAVRDLGYVHNSRTKKIKLGCIMAVTVEKYSDPFFTNILSAMEKECEECGATISLVRKYTELQDPYILQELFDANLSGLIIMERMPQDLLSKIEKKIPNILFIDNDEEEQDYDGVSFNHNIANMQVMDCLLKCGYRRIAMISGSSPETPLENSIRLSCYREALRRSNIPYDESLVKDCAWDLDICEKQVKEIMNLENPPDAIFAGSDSLASCILGTLYSMHYVVPDDVGVIGFNNLSFSSRMIPPLTTIDIPTKEIGIAAIQRMIEMVKKRNLKKRKIIFATKLIKRESLKGGK